MRIFRRWGQWLDQRNVGVRLGLAFGLVLAMAAALGASGLVGLHRVNGASSQLAQKWLPGVGLLAATRASVLEFREQEVKHTLATDTGYMGDYEEKLTGLQQDIDKSLADYLALGTGADERALYDAFHKSWEAYLTVHVRLLGLDRAGKQDDARDISDGAAKMALDDVIESLDRLTAFNFDAGKAAAEAASGVYRMTRIGVLALLAVALALGALLSFFITRSLVRQLGGQPAEAARLARAVAAGDLTTAVALDAGDTTSLMACLKSMQESLALVVGKVRANAEVVATASAQIAQGNQDLSGRTEEQAGALQQTASTTSALGTTVQANASSAQRANDLARGASDVAVKGGVVVHDVVDTMRGINESARRIADIIGVIDGIAFQTNILALNAAVEAARAGEQGRGFAVVASEVRMLAQRSAAAAREIKELINSSVERVEHGSTLVDHAGATMNEVVEAIRRVSDIVAQMSAASAEQSASVSQVGDAIAQMDRTTQQNAALVEQGATAANSLREQSQELVDAVAVFRIEAADAHPAASRFVAA